MNSIFLAQLFGILGAASMMISSWQKKRKRIFFFLLFDNIFYFLQYIVLNAYSGAFINVVGLARTIIFSKKGESKFLKTNYPLYLIIILNIVVNIFTYDGIKSLFPAIASIIYAIVLWQEKPKSIRKGTSIMLLMWFVYDITVNAYVGALTEGILFISSVIALYKFDIRKEQKNEQSNEHQYSV